MIFVSHALPVNEPGQPHLDRAAVWDGLVLKANNALPFVAAMTSCEVVERISPTVFDRDIEFRGQQFRERITLEEPHRVVFTRTAGPVLGTIANEIEGSDDDLRLRFSFSLTVEGVEGGSAQEKEYADGMTADYLTAVASTLAAIRRVAAGDTAPANTAAAPSPADAPDWIVDYYDDVDHMRLAPYVARHSADAQVIFANQPPAVGRDAIGASIGGFWSIIGGLRHERRNVWLVNDGATAVLEVLVHYTTAGGAAVDPLPCVSILDRNAAGEVTSLRVHIDLAPLFAAMGAEQAAQPAEQQAEQVSA